VKTGLVKGNLVRWLGGAAGTVGVVAELSNGGRQARVAFDGAEDLTFAAPFAAIPRLVFSPGLPVRLVSEDALGVVLVATDLDGLMVYQISLPGEVVKTVLESALRPGVITDPAALLRRGDLHSARSTNLRLTAMRLQFAHRFEELSSLSNSRVEIKPHQVGVLHRVASSYPHRFLLADEVGLGKTIEAGLILKELKARGVANRVLILAPSGIVSQWQAEMRTKFSLAFSLYRGDTVRFLQQDKPNENVWTLNDNIVTSMSYASWGEARRREIAVAGWDIVVIDEAHHARRSWQGPAKYRETQAFKLAEMLADPDVGRSTGFLMLTATPMQLHRFELYSLIELLDPALFRDYPDFDQHADSLAGLNQTVEALRRWPTLSAGTKQSVSEDVAGWTGAPGEATRSALTSTAGRASLEDELLGRGLSK
jgi:ATP-dependent helicase HepA